MSKQASARGAITRRRVEFADTDQEGIVHFARYLVYMETAEHDLLRSAGASVTRDPDGQPWVWPRVQVSCEYLAPLSFGDTVEIETRVTKVGRSSVTYEHTLRSGDVVAARGRVKTVCCRRGGEGALRPTPVPEAFAEQLQSIAI